LSKYLLLLHELGVGAVVDDVATKDGSGEDGVNLLGIDVLELAVEDEVVASGTNGNGRLLAEEDESEDIAELSEIKR
jgi:hypothetical protein